MNGHLSCGERRWWRRPVGLLAALVLAHGCTSGSARTAADVESGTIVVTTDHFAFHSDPWINLHHFLYEWARTDLGIPSGRPYVSERARLDTLTDVDRNTWIEAVAFYRDSVATLHPNLGQLRAINAALFHANPASAPSAVAVLQSAIPVYRTMWWPAHDRANRAWIESLAPLLRCTLPLASSRALLRAGKPCPIISHSGFDRNSSGGRTGLCSDLRSGSTGCLSFAARRLSVAG